MNTVLPRSPERALKETFPGYTLGKGEDYFYNHIYVYEPRKWLGVFPKDVLLIDVDQMIENSLSAVRLFNGAEEIPGLVDKLRVLGYIKFEVC